MSLVCHQVLLGYFIPSCFRAQVLELDCLDSIPSTLSDQRYDLETYSISLCLIYKTKQQNKMVTHLTRCPGELNGLNSGNVHWRVLVSALLIWAVISRNSFQAGFSHSGFTLLPALQMGVKVNLLKIKLTACHFLILNMLCLSDSS